MTTEAGSLRMFTDLPERTVLALCTGVAGWQGIVISGLVVAGLDSTQPFTALAAAAAASSFAIAAKFLFATLAGRPMSAGDHNLLAWLIGIAVLTAAAVALASRHSRDLPMLVWCAGFLAANAGPALLLRGHATPAREPHRPKGTARVLSIVLVGVLVAGWTAGLSGLGYAVANPWDFDANNDYNITLQEHVGGGIVFASEVQWVGFVFGFIGGVSVVVHALAFTKLNRSMPFVFLPPLLIGPVVTFFDPLLSICVVACVVTFLSAIAMRLFPLPKAGQCSSCGYDLAGLQGHGTPCPECGSVPHAP